MRSDRLLLQDVLDAIDTVGQYLPSDRAAFDANALLQSHIYRHVMIVREAMWRLIQVSQSREPTDSLATDRRNEARPRARLLPG
jgi:uncharacterized protein with HEPN domain